MLSSLEQSIEQMALSDWWKVYELGLEEDALKSFEVDESWITEEICLLMLRVFELWIEEEDLFSFDLDDSLFDEEICFLLPSCAELSDDQDCIGDLWVDNDGEDDLLFWLPVENLLSEDDICMLKLSCLEQSIEQEALPDWWKVYELWFEEEALLSFKEDDSWIVEEICLLMLRVFELWIKEEALLSFDCDDGLIDEEIWLLLLSFPEQSSELGCIRDLWSWVDNDDEHDLLSSLIFEILLSEDEICMLKLSWWEHWIEEEALPDW